MPNANALRNETWGWLLPAFFVVFSITLFRVVMLASNKTDLFVDEAQYWLWGQELAFGYYSKPPMIGWVIRAFTEIGGSDSAFWIRLPGPLLHGATALILAAITAPRFGREAAIWVAAGYLTLPMVTVGSLLISTDTIMVPFVALALGAWLRGLELGGSRNWAILAGASLGIGFLGKYAAIYFIICAALAAMLMWEARPGRKAALAGLAAFLVAISPNILWNLFNGLSTVEHTLDNADWVRDPGEKAELNLAGLAEFLGSQLAVFGPIFFVCLIFVATRFRRLPTDGRILLLFSIPIIAIVSVQALLSQAYANWAATAYVAGTILVIPWLLDGRRGWLWTSMGVHGALALMLPFMTVFGTGWRVGLEGDYILARYLGRSDASQMIVAAAAQEDLDVIVADNRDILADLFHATKGSHLAIFARPVTGRAPNHYVLKHSMPLDLAGDVLLVSRRPKLGGACEARKVGAITPDVGAYADQPQRIYVTSANCVAQHPVGR